MDAISAIVCTRHRPSDVARLVGSVLGDHSESIELIVIDQSDNAETERILEQYRTDGRLRYIRSTTRGKGAALNEGLQLARSSIVVCTDDDCEVPPGWVTGMARVLQSQPAAAIAFGRVIAAPHDRHSGYVPVVELRGRRLVRSTLGACGGLGGGAAMALRRDFIRSIGGFDESFGPGARFPGAEEGDMALRALIAGQYVYETNELTIVHYGFRTFEEGRKHAQRDWIGIGALCAKPLHAGCLRAAMVPLWFFLSRAVWPPFADMLRLRRPAGLARIVGFLRGFGEGLKTPVDRKTMQYVRRPTEATQGTK
jgi:GT2 family glycosyltransferase